MPAISDFQVFGNSPQMICFLVKEVKKYERKKLICNLRKSREVQNEASERILGFDPVVTPLLWLVDELWAGPLGCSCVCWWGREPEWVPNAVFPDIMLLTSPQGRAPGGPPEDFWGPLLGGPQYITLLDSVRTLRPGLSLVKFKPRSEGARVPI